MKEKYGLELETVDYGSSVGGGNYKTEVEVTRAAIILCRILLKAKIIMATDIYIGKNTVSFRGREVTEKVLPMDSKDLSEIVNQIKILEGVMYQKNCKSSASYYGKADPLFFKIFLNNFIIHDYKENDVLVLSVIEQAKLPIPINHLGFTKPQVECIDEICNAEKGLILVCGNNGAEKSTTTASMIMEFNNNRSGKTNIISIEDYSYDIIPGATLARSYEQAGCNFKNYMDYLLGNNPDAIVAGRLDNMFKCKIAVEAVLSGSLVFAKLNADTLEKAFSVLKKLGINYNITASLVKCIIVQKLSYIEENMKLYADITVPQCDFSLMENKYMELCDITRYFSHCTNYEQKI